MGDGTDLLQSSSSSSRRASAKIDPVSSKKLTSFSFSIKASDPVDALRNRLLTLLLLLLALLLLPLPPPIGASCRGIATPAGDTPPLLLTVPPLLFTLATVVVTLLPTVADAGERAFAVGTPREDGPTGFATAAAAACGREPITPAPLEGPGALAAADNPAKGAPREDPAAAASEEEAAAGGATERGLCLASMILEDAPHTDPGPGPCRCGANCEPFATGWRRTPFAVVELGVPTGLEDTAGGTAGLTTPAPPHAPPGAPPPGGTTCTCEGDGAETRGAVPVAAAAVAGGGDATALDRTGVAAGTATFAGLDSLAQTTEEVPPPPPPDPTGGAGAAAALCC